MPEDDLDGSVGFELCPDRALGQSERLDQTLFGAAAGLGAVAVVGPGTVVLRRAAVLDRRGAVVLATGRIGGVGAVVAR